MATFNISLPEQLRAVVEERSRARGCRSPQEYIEKLIEKDQQPDSDELEPEWVEQAVVEGLNSGPAVRMTPEDWAEIRREAEARIRKRG